MSLIQIRKIRIDVEEIFHERGPRRSEPLTVATAAAVVQNPFAGRHEGDLLPFMSELRSVGKLLAQKLVEKFDGPRAVQAYGKGAIVGEDGELEHGALWHEAGGWAMREVLGNPKAIVPAAKTVASPGTRLMVPLGHVQAAYVRSHFGTAEVTVWDAPRRDEIVYALAMANGGRIHARIGGLQASEVRGDDGLR